MTPKDKGALLICAVRYALGRRTYMPSEVCRIARTSLYDVPDCDRECIARDIREAIARDLAGDPCDVAEWRALLVWMGAAQPESPI